MDESIFWLYFCIGMGSLLLAMLSFAGIGCFYTIVKMIQTIVDIRECLWHSLFWKEREEERAG